MCIIFQADKKALISGRLIRESWRGAGAGLMYLDDGELVVHTQLMTPEAVESVLDDIPDCAPVAVHLRRVRTLAPLPENTHPFKVDDRRYMMQVGTFSRGNPNRKPSYCEAKKLARILGNLEHGDQNFVLAGLTKNPGLAFLTGTEKGFSRWGSWVETKAGLHIADSNLLGG